MLYEQHKLYVFILKKKEDKQTETHLFTQNRHEKQLGEKERKRSTDRDRLYV